MDSSELMKNLDDKRPKARAAAPKPASDDLAKLQGEWVMATGVADGFAIPDEMKRDFKRVCRGKELTVLNGEQLIMKATITLDQTKNPKTIDYDVIDGPTKGQKHLGIYDLNGDTFRSCFAAPDSPRPSEFKSESGDRQTFSEWTRAKKQ